MSIKKLMLNLPCVSLLSLIPTSNVIKFDGFSSPKFGPFYVGNDDEDITLKYLTNKSDFTCYESMIISYPGMDPIYTSRTKNRYVESASLLQATFTVPLKDYFSDYGLDIKFTSHNYTTNRVLYESKVSLYPMRSEVINPLLLKDTNYKARPVYFKITNGVISNNDEVYDFSRMFEYFEENSYLYLDINNFGFDYYSSEPFSYSLCEIKFIDKNNLFPHWPRRIDGSKRIPLKLVKEEEKVYLRFSKSFYYDPLTLQMSEISRTGYVPTDYFYLPQNYEEELKDYTFYIILNDLGTSKLKIDYPVYFDSTGSIFGKPGNSKYWIEGGIVK